MMSCLTRIPVISSKARARVLDSYSWVVMVSETTLTSLIPRAFSLSAAWMNHFISASCCAGVRVEGLNSWASQRSAAA
jgi:hypothetical protein